MSKQVSSSADLPLPANGILKQKARDELNKSWNLPVLFSLTLLLLAAGAGAVTLPLASGQTPGVILGFFIELILLLIIRLFAFGAYRHLMQRIRREETDYRDLIYVFRHQPDRFLLVSLAQAGLLAAYLLPIYAFACLMRYSFAVMLTLIILWVIIGAALLGSILLATVQTPFLLLDDSDLKVQKALRMSARVMRGYRVQYLKLVLSFLPWLLLSILTLGVGLIWLLPYMMTSFTFFFDALLYPAEI